MFAVNNSKEMLRHREKKTKKNGKKKKWHEIVKSVGSAMTQ